MRLTPFDDLGSRRGSIGSVDISGSQDLLLEGF